jgi:hypothetical protein
MVSGADKMQEPQFFAVYRFPEGQAADIENSSYLLKIVDSNSLKLEKQSGKKIRYTYVVTAIDRCRNESLPSKVITSSY